MGLVREPFTLDPNSWQYLAPEFRIDFFFTLGERNGTLVREHVD